MAPGTPAALRLHKRSPRAKARVQPHLQPGPRQPPCHPHCAGQTWHGTGQRVAAPHPAGPPAASLHPALRQGALGPQRGRVLHMRPPPGAAAATRDAQQRAGTSQPPASSRARQLWVRTPGCMPCPITVLLDSWLSWAEWLQAVHRPKSGISRHWGWVETWRTQSNLCKGSGAGRHRKGKGCEKQEGGQGTASGLEAHMLGRTLPEIRGEPSSTGAVTDGLHSTPSHWSITQPRTGARL